MTIIYCLGWVDDADDIFYVDPWLTNIPPTNVRTLECLLDIGSASWTRTRDVTSNGLSEKWNFVFWWLIFNDNEINLVTETKKVCSSHPIRCKKYSWIFISFRLNTFNLFRLVLFFFHIFSIVLESYLSPTYGWI